MKVFCIERSFLFFSVVEFGILLHENSVLLYETQSLSHFFTRVIFFTIASSSSGISETEVLFELNLTPSEAFE